MSTISAGAEGRKKTGRAEARPVDTPLAPGYASLGGTGGLIAIDKKGEIALPFNTNGMYRGYVDPKGKFVVEIYH